VHDDIKSNQIQIRSEKYVVTNKTRRSKIAGENSWALHDQLKSNQMHTGWQTYTKPQKKSLIKQKT